jgi:tetratricopeptide (TPR) repeat protein
MTGALLLLLLAAGGAQSDAQEPRDRGVIANEDRLAPIVRRPPKPSEEQGETSKSGKTSPQPEEVKERAKAGTHAPAEEGATQAAPDRVAEPAEAAAAPTDRTWWGSEEGIRRTRPHAEEDPDEEPPADAGPGKAARAPEPVEPEDGDWEATDEEEASPAAGDLLAGFSDLPEADVRALRKALRERPDRVGLWIDLGNAYARLYHSDEALAAYDRALALDPDSTVAWSNKGGVLLSVYKDKEAVAAFEEALRTDFYDAMAHYNLGVAHDRLNHYDEAIHHYQIALTLEPDLKVPSVNPNIVNNRHTQVLRLRLYRDAGGALSLPLQPGGEQ